MSADLKSLVKRYDPDGVGLTISLLVSQIEQVVETFPKSVPLLGSKIQRVVVCAMGGSALGADMLRSAYDQDLLVPVMIVNDYHVPAWANRSTLVIAISYSGTTEETISCLHEAKSRKLPLFVIAKGGSLITFAKEHRIPHYQFPTDCNPSGQPRLGTGYTMTGVYLLMKKLGLIKKGASDLVRLSKTINDRHEAAEVLSRKWVGKSFVVIAAEHLRGNAHTLSNQLNESAKAFAPFYVVPELNHHLLEGFGSLRSSRKQWTILSLESKSYSARIAKRFSVTRAVLEKQGFAIERIAFSGGRAKEMLECLAFGSWLSYYLALRGGFRPSEIPWVDYFKARMKH